MNTNSGFKYLFIGLSIFFLMLVSGAVAVLFYYRPAVEIGPKTSLPFAVLFIPLVIMLTILGSIAALVYKDAKQRGMDPWFWATVATFIPHLLGVITYLVVRHSYNRVCLHCGRGLQPDFLNCPYCGHDVETVCAQCKMTVAADWKICPRCQAPLTEGRKD